MRFDQPRHHRSIINSCSFLNWIAEPKQIIKRELQIQWSRRTRPVPNGVRPQATQCRDSKMQRVQPHVPTRADQVHSSFLRSIPKKINGEQGAFFEADPKMVFLNKVSRHERIQSPSTQLQKVPIHIHSTSALPLLINQSMPSPISF